MGSVNKRWLILLLIVLAGCGGMMDDLAPSGSDKRPPVQCDITGTSVCQIAPDFALPDTLGGSVTLSSELTTTNTKGVVLYFTMWCSSCRDDMIAMRNFFSAFPNVHFIAVDYVSGSAAVAAQSQSANGFSDFIVLADTQRNVMNLYQAQMGTTVVIDRAGVVRMNESYKDGARLQAALSSLP